jgi:hypothetical protein
VASNTIKTGGVLFFNAVLRSDRVTAGEDCEGGNR